MNPKMKNIAAALAATLAGMAQAQSLTVLPVSIQLTPGQGATSLTVLNQGDAATSVQVRVFAWNQASGTDELVESSSVLTSPPLAMIAPGNSQVIRLALREVPVGKEATYRILVDQIPAPADPGTVRIALRLSIPVFAEPKTRTTPSISYRIERKGSQAWLVAANDGSRHDTIRDIALTAKGSPVLGTGANASPYVLAGATRRWMIESPGGALPEVGGTMRLTGKGDSGPVDQLVRVVASR